MLKELTARYENIKKKYAPLMIVGVRLIVVGGIPFLLERKNITSGFLVPYYSVFVALIAVGAYIFIRIVATLETYTLMVKNEEHINRFIFKLRKKVTKKGNDF